LTSNAIYVVHIFFMDGVHAGRKPSTIFPVILVGKHLV